MKIAIANRDPLTYPGGDLIQIAALIEALKPLEIYEEWPMGFRPNFSKYDLVHAYHLNFSWSNIIYTNIWEQNKPYFITGIFYPQDDLGSTAEQMREYVNRSLFTVIHSNWEKSELLDITKCDESKIRVIPNGVSREFCSAINDEYDRSGVITVSARDGDKNTSLVKQICSELNIPYTNIYGKNPYEMPNIYKSAKVFVNASSSERMSLTTHEALAAHCRVVSTKYNRGNEYFPGLITCDPDDYEDLKYKIQLAHNSPYWAYLPNVFARELTWENTAKEYQKCLLALQ